MLGVPWPCWGSCGHARGPVAVLGVPWSFWGSYGHAGCPVAVPGSCGRAGGPVVVLGVLWLCRRCCGCAGIPWPCCRSCGSTGGSVAVLGVLRPFWESFGCAGVLWPCWVSHGHGGGPWPGPCGCESLRATLTPSSPRPPICVLGCREPRAVPKPPPAPRQSPWCGPGHVAVGGVAVVGGAHCAGAGARVAEVTTSPRRPEEAAAPGPGGSVAARWATCRPCCPALPAPAASASARASSAPRPRRPPAPSAAGGCGAARGTDRQMGWTGHWHLLGCGTTRLRVLTPRWGPLAWPPPAWRCRGTWGHPHGAEAARDAPPPERCPRRDGAHRSPGRGRC